jgi:HD-GYP domain-containing protein (c-di-GMP phosphodiesterase class II)
VLCRALASNGRAIGPDSQPDAEVTLPCTDAALLEVIGRLGNAAVETGWQALPAAPRAALTRSLALFKDLKTLINNDGRLDYGTVTDACAPVIDTVRQSAHAEVFEGLRNHDDYNFVHSLRVATLLGLFGYTIGLDDPSLMTLASAGLLHDVGKAAVPKAVMYKTGKLAPNEMVLARGHVERTVIYLESHSNVPKAVVTIAGQHHERLDGSGYPNRLPASQINDLSRMAAIVDVFCALTERRPHRAALSPYQALEVMQETIRPQLDQNMVRLFSGMLLTAA